MMKPVIYKTTKNAFSFPVYPSPYTTSMNYLKIIHSSSLCQKNHDWGTDQRKPIF